LNIDQNIFSIKEGICELVKGNDYVLWSVLGYHRFISKHQI